MNNRWIIFLTVFVTLLLITTILISAMGSDVWLGNFIPLILTSIGFILGGLVFYLVFRPGQYARRYNIAMVGFPMAGKTTLLTTLFGEIFNRRIKWVKASLDNDETVEMVNKNLALLEKGRVLGPTTSETRFFYATNVRIKSLFGETIYKIEFGDDEGEKSRQYLTEYGEWLHDTPYFKYVYEADAIIFFVDLGRYLLEKNAGSQQNYISVTKKAIRAAWMNLKLHTMETKMEQGKAPVVLVFAKADLFGVAEEVDTDIYKKKIYSLGFSEEETPPIHTIDPICLQQGMDKVVEEFRDLIVFLEEEITPFKYIFTSSFGEAYNVQLGRKERLGVADLLRAVLPPGRGIVRTKG